MAKVSGMFLLLILLSFPAGAQPPGPKTEQVISIIFSSNVQGEVEPCG